MAGDPEQDVRSALPKLPKATALAASLVRDGNWYALSSKQIKSVRQVLARAPFSVPPGIRVELPPLEHRIVLWTTGEQGLVPEDVVRCDDCMNLLYSTKIGRFYEMSGSIEQGELLKLIDAIKDGSDTGVRAATRRTK
jgi:hypothetical protein